MIKSTLNIDNNTMHSFLSTIRIALFLVLMIVSSGIFAQKYSAEIGFIQPQRYGNDFKSDFFNGVRMGAHVEFDLGKNFTLLSGTLYSVVYSRNSQYYTPTDSVVYQTFNHSIHIPVQAYYYLPVSKNFKFLAFAGPTISVGLAEPQKVTASISASNKAEIEGIIPENMKGFMRTESATYRDNDLYAKSLIRRINFQITVGGGIQFKNYQLKAGYDFGINSINKVDTNSILRQRGWFTSFVYKF